ncbi:MAG: hypothetical protein M3425_02855 [Actinomycetota bacterium]|nr:hypothetical protein [Actinomycetota bacterium]
MRLPEHRRLGDLAQDRRTQLLFTGSQLRVRVSAVGANGGIGQTSPWFAVGEGTQDGVPIPQPDAGSGHHRPGHHFRASLMMEAPG